ncbi:MAG TPA: LLM class flavin-dependent oxidoreductase [Acidimicrobiia bacterium]|nr:LLM class flavin-dependent oxidoreductase [Acidimicrobiia bacterium]
MRAGLALPQFDFSVAGDAALDWDTVAGYAALAEGLGFDSVWLCDHLFFSTEKYGGPTEPSGGFEPVVTLGALARVTSRVRLGSLVFCEALRPASVLAKALASLDVIADGRLDIGLGAGWYEPEYLAIGMELPPPGVRLARLRDALQVCRGLLDGGPCTFDGRYHRAFDAHNEPAARQRPTPPIIVGGKGDRLLGIVAELADGWNTCWAWTFDDYRERVDVLERACARVERDPATVSRSLGLYALCGESEADLEQRFRRLVSLTPPGVLDGMTLEQWRHGRLVGTVEQVREQVAHWSELGVDTIVAGVGAVPFAVTTADDVALLAHALELELAPSGQSAG